MEFSIQWDNYLPIAHYYLMYIERIEEVVLVVSQE